MRTVCGNPEDRATFQGQRAAHSQRIFNPPGRFVAAMGQEPMVAHADAQTPGDPPQHDREQKRFPVEYEQRSHSTNMKGHHEQGGYPDDALRKRFIPSENAQ